MRRSGNILDNGFALVFIVSAIVVISVMPMLAIAISDGEAYFDTDGDYAYGLEEEPTIIWQGDVTLINGTTFEFTACNEPYNAYEVNATTGMGALDATGLTYNASDEWYATYGSFLLESIAGIANEPWAPDSKSWAIFVNDAPAPMGLSGNDLADGDNVKFYFLPWDPVTYEPLVEQATYLVNINVTVHEILFDGVVTVKWTTFAFTACNEPYNTYEVNATTGMGALDATGLTYNASDEWYATYGSFLLESIAGIANEPWAPDSKSWAIFVNDAPAPMGLSGNDLVDGDNVKFYFLPWDPVTYEPLVEQATYLVNINVSVSPPPPTPTPTPRPHRGGGGVPRDSDHDGYSDVEELLAGTNPNDPNDYPSKPAVAPAPRATPTPSTMAITPTLTPLPTPAPTATPVPATPTPEEPGFEAFFAIAGLITVAYLVLRRKKE